MRAFEVGAPRGRGMRLVEGIADRWGVEDPADGKRVWFELAAPGLAAATPGDGAGNRTTEEETA